MCEGWRVREVVAHTTMPARYSPEQFMAEVQAAAGDFTRVSNTVADRDGRLPSGVLLGNLRDEVLHRWTPPGGGAHGALNHAVIHTLDVTVPLGKTTCSDDTLRVVLDDLAAGGGAQEFFGLHPEGLSFEATDLDWRAGSGTPVRGTAGELALLLTGRTLPDGRDLRSRGPGAG